MLPANSPLPDPVPASAAAPRRFLAPLKRVGDGGAAVAYVAGLRDRHACVAFLHVERSFQPEDRAAADPAAAVIGHAETLGAGSGLRHESYILAGNTAFAILDTAEMLGCEAIVMRASSKPGWRRVFSSSLVDEVAGMVRDVPLVQVDEHGVFVRSSHP